MKSVDAVRFEKAAERHAAQIAALVRHTVREIYPQYRKTLFGNVVKKCIQCSRTSEKRNNIVKKFKYSASYFELYTKFTPNEKDFRCGFQISYEP